MVAQTELSMPPYGSAAELSSCIPAAMDATIKKKMVLLICSHVLPTVLSDVVTKSEVSQMDVF
jgi:hypothetical protein